MDVRLFGLFIFACGTTHAMHVWTVWRPDYWAEGLVKAGTAVLSLSTGLLLLPLLPKAMALRSPTELEQLNGEFATRLGGPAASDPTAPGVGSSPARSH